MIKTTYQGKEHSSVDHGVTGVRCYYLGVKVRAHLSLPQYPVHIYLLLVCHLYVCSCVCMYTWGGHQVSCSITLHLILLSPLWTWGLLFFQLALDSWQVPKILLSLPSAALELLVHTAILETFCGCWESKLVQAHTTSALTHCMSSWLTVPSCSV